MYTNSKEHKGLKDLYRMKPEAYQVIPSSHHLPFVPELAVA